MDVTESKPYFNPSEVILRLHELSLTDRKAAQDFVETGGQIVKCFTLRPSIPNWWSLIPFFSRNSMFVSGYGSGHRYLVAR